MGWRFRKSIKILPGVKLNFNKKSVGITFGGKGAHYTINSKGKRTASIGIPGTGLYYTESSRSSKKGSSPAPSMQSNNFQSKKPRALGCLIPTLIFIILVSLSGAMLSENSSSSDMDANYETSSAPETETETQSVETMYTTASLNVRSGPGTEYDIITTLDVGEAVAVIQVLDNWAELEFSPSPAYVSLNYLSSEPYVPETTQESKGPMVWISRTGTKYHSNPSCSGMKGTTQIPLEDAQSRGRTPCSKCY